MWDYCRVGGFLQVGFRFIWILQVVLGFGIFVSNFDTKLVSNVEIIRSLSHVSVTPD